MCLVSSTRSTESGALVFKACWMREAWKISLPSLCCCHPLSCDCDEKQHHMRVVKYFKSTAPTSAHGLRGIWWQRARALMPQQCQSVLCAGAATPVLNILLPVLVSLLLRCPIQQSDAHSDCAQAHATEASCFGLHSEEGSPSLDRWPVRPLLHPRHLLSSADGPVE